MVSDFNKKQNRDNLSQKFLLIFGGILILGVVALLIFANSRIYNKREKLISEIENLKNKIENIQQRNDELKQGIANAENDQYIEKVAREELDLQKEGEKVVSFVITPNQSSSNNSQSKNTLQIWIGWLSSGWQWIKNSPSQIISIFKNRN